MFLPPEPAALLHTNEMLSEGRS